MLPILIKKETPFFNQIDLEFRNVYTTPFFNLIAEKSSDNKLQEKKPWVIIFKEHHVFKMPLQP